jgi:hypothetical protein
VRKHRLCSAQRAVYNGTERLLHPTLRLALQWTGDLSVELLYRGKDSEPVVRRFILPILGNFEYSFQC